MESQIPPDHRPVAVSVMVDLRDRGLRKAMIAAGWKGEDLINASKVGEKYYFCWKSED